jgi:hypothetical protein
LVEEPYKTFQSIREFCHCCIVMKENAFIFQSSEGSLNESYEISYETCHAKS